jgi:sec-independent protein translocase protein TatC
MWKFISPGLHENERKHSKGFIFELPIIVYFLTKVGLVTPEILRKYRKISLVVVLILAAVITPPDVASQVVVAVPILVLYQVSIYISKRVLKSEAKKEAKLAAERAKKG